MIRFCPLLPVVPQGVSSLGISTGDMMVVARSFPSLRTLALSDIDQAALGWEQECKLKPLSQLTGLTDLSIAARRGVSVSTLASLSSLKQLASLKLQLVNDGLDGFCHVLPHLRSLWGLHHLAHLSCTYTDKWSAQQIGRAPENRDNVQPHRAVVTAQALGFPSTAVEMIFIRGVYTLSGCRNLSSLQLPWASFQDGAAERLATRMPQLTRLSVNSLWPGVDPMPACSWREVTLCGGPQLLSSALFRRPLEGMEHLRITHLVIPRFIDSDSVDNFVRMMGQRGRLLATKLQAARNNGPGVRLSFIYGLEFAQLARVIASLTVLDGAVDAYCSGHTRLEGSHKRALATALPRLTHLSVVEPGLLGDDAWATLGTFPSLKTFSAVPDDEDSFFRLPSPTMPFSPLHMALLASSVTRPLCKRLCLCFVVCHISRNC